MTEAADGAAGEVRELRDSQGRRIKYLRLSITGRCNFRCVYCMPGRARTPPEEALSFDELLRCCALAAAWGVETIKVTGGEPLVRPGAAGFIAALKTLPGIRQVTLTTNGLLLEKDLDRLAAAALDGVNISLDTLDPENFRRITGRSGLDTVLRSLSAAVDRGLRVKVNCVPLRGINDHEIPALAALARDRPVPVRFIELMPLGAAASFEPLTGAEAAAALERRYGPLSPLSPAEKLGNGPAVYYRLKDFAGPIGFIQPLSRCFCGNCDRLRLTSQGFLASCLAGGPALDLRSLLRSGAGGRDLIEAVGDLAARKPAGRNFSPAPGPDQAPYRSREMFRIGG
jgi:cyclic pyranopterin phosphate synthase